ncbi:nagb/rpia/CoA transferase-like protein [Gautieria morchelliformis]|nr:nagb/rpia/CoA transferase-like protein [Gautieria morchelliformis]
MAPASPAPVSFDVYAAYRRILDTDHSISMPIAAILALTELIAQSNAGTMSELVGALNDGAEILKSNAPNPISLSAGLQLFAAFVTIFPHESDNFQDLKRELVRQGQEYAKQAAHSRAKIASLALDFIQDDSVILTHSYSRVVEQALLHAYRHGNKRFSVYVTEARPSGLGSKTYDSLSKAGIPCTVILDAAVAYAMGKVDLVLVGSEAVVESGGLVNAVGSYQIALIAKAANVPFYALAESYKFHRMFPLSQYDLPTHTDEILCFPVPTNTRPLRPGLTLTKSSARNVINSPPAAPSQSAAGIEYASTMTRSSLTEEQLKCNPEVDYTKPDLITLVFSDVGILTPEGVSQYLVGMFAG